MPQVTRKIIIIKTWVINFSSPQCCRVSRIIQTQKVSSKYPNKLMLHCCSYTIDLRCICTRFFLAWFTNSYFHSTVWKKSSHVWSQNCWQQHNQNFWWINFYSQSPLISSVKTFPEHNRTIILYLKGLHIRQSLIPRMVLCEISCGDCELKFIRGMFNIKCKSCRRQTYDPLISFFQTIEWNSIVTNNVSDHCHDVYKHQ